MARSNPRPTSPGTVSDTVFQILAFAAIGVAVAHLWNSSQATLPIDLRLSPTESQAYENQTDEKIEISLHELSEDIRKDLFTLNLRLNVLEEATQKAGSSISKLHSRNKGVIETSADIKPLPPLTQKEAQTLLKEVQQQIKEVDISLGWSNLLMNRLREDNPLNMSRAVYSALNDRFANYSEVTQAIRLEIYDVWKADPVAVGEDPRPILEMLTELNSEWSYLDEELQEFLSPEEYAGFSNLASIARREQTVISYLERELDENSGN